MIKLPASLVAALTLISVFVGSVPASYLFVSSYRKLPLAPPDSYGYDTHAPNDGSVAMLVFRYFVVMVLIAAALYFMIQELVARHLRTNPEHIREYSKYQRGPHPKGHLYFLAAVAGVILTLFVETFTGFYYWALVLAPIAAVYGFVRATIGYDHDYAGRHPDHTKDVIKEVNLNV